MKKLSATLKAIVKQLNDGEFHSGASLGEALNISRNAIWKHINQLVKYGVAIESTQRMGYRLKSPLILLDGKKIKQSMATLPPLTKTPLNPAIKVGKLEILGSIPSTNDYCRTQPSVDGLHICLAEHQSKGKGRFGRDWHSPFGANIYLSCGWPVEQDVSNLSGLSLVVSLAVITALTDYGIADLSIKWPNDIVWQGKKLGGILIELQAESHALTQVIIGIGLNVNMSHADTSHISQPWTSLQTILSAAQDRNKIVGLLLARLMHYITLFTQYGFGHFSQQWLQYDNLLHRKIGLKVGKDIIYGIAQGTNSQGYLLLKNDQNIIQAYSSGETTLLKE